MNTTDEKTLQPPSGAAEQRPPATYPQPSYPTTPPAQSYAPPGPTQQLPPYTTAAAQRDEQYRSELYAMCANGHHQKTTKFGICGIITAVVCFPIGLICLCLDSEKTCSRCGIRLEN